MLSLVPIQGQERIHTKQILMRRTVRPPLVQSSLFAFKIDTNEEVNFVAFNMWDFHKKVFAWIGISSLLYSFSCHLILLQTRLYGKLTCLNSSFHYSYNFLSLFLCDIILQIQCMLLFCVRTCMEHCIRAVIM